MVNTPIILDLPVPPSVNKTRRVNWAASKLLSKWKRASDGFLMAARFRSFNRIPRFELLITLSEDHTNQDLDNPIKNLIDYLRLIEVVENDAKKNMRRLVVEWGDAPIGCRVEVRAAG